MSEGSFVQSQRRWCSPCPGSCSPCPGSISPNAQGGWQDLGTAPRGRAAPCLLSFSWLGGLQQGGSWQALPGRCSFMH